MSLLSGSLPECRFIWSRSARGSCIPGSLPSGSLPQGRITWDRSTGNHCIWGSLSRGRSLRIASPEVTPPGLGSTMQLVEASLLLKSLSWPRQAHTYTLFEGLVRIPPRISNGEQESGSSCYAQFDMGLGMPIFGYVSPRWAHLPLFKNFDCFPTGGRTGSSTLGS